MTTTTAPKKAAPKKPAVKKAAAKMAAKPLPKRADWQTQVYDPEGKWCGFFMDEETAKKWVGKRDGYEITDRKPERTLRVGSGEAQDANGVTESADDDPEPDEE